MKSLIVTCAAIAAIACLSAGAAEAGGPYGYSYGTIHSTNYNNGLGGFYTNSPMYYPSFQSPTYVYTQPSVAWHNTSHWDRVPASFSIGPAGLQYNPGGYVWHNDGHYDVVNGGLHDHHHHP